MELRSATQSDAPAIARLHANSWRFAYRGALRDQYLDAEADSDRLNLWQDRLGWPAPNQNVFILTDNASLIGFASVYVDDHPEFGSLLNNLHVADTSLRLGCGTRLMSAVHACCCKHSPTSPVYLWVVDSNQRAQAFYSRLGAKFRGTDHWKPPGGGTALVYRFAWDSPNGIRLAKHAA